MTDTDDEYRMWIAWKYDDDWNVRPGWDSNSWFSWFWENAPKTSTKHCHTTTRP